MKKIVFLLCAFSAITCNIRDSSNPVSSSFSLAGPSALEAAVITESAVVLDWTIVTSEAEYANAPFQIMIERSADGITYAVVDSVAGTITTKAVPGIYQSGTTYSFRARSKSATITSAYSNSITARCVLTAPSGLTVAAFTESSASLQWADNSTFETGFLIERSADGTSYSVVDSVGANVTQKAVAGIYQAGVTYSFRVRAKSVYNASAYSNVGTTNLVFAAPSALIVAAITETSALLQWTDNSSFETGFLIMRSSDGTNYTAVDSVGANVIAKAVAGIYLPGVTYSFKVRAKAINNTTAFSNSASAVCVLAAPAGLITTFVTESSVSLQWTDKSAFETGFLIERSADGVTYSPADSVGANVTTKTVAGVYLTGRTYVFRVRARSAYHTSMYSNSATANFIITAPSGLKVIAITSASASLQWTDNSIFETEFLIERSTDGTNYSVVDSAGANVTTKSVAGVYQPFITYTFRTRARSVYSTSDYSNAAAGSIHVGDAGFVQITGGLYRMGSNDALDYGASPAHAVTVSSFYMEKNEITYEKWTEVRDWALLHGYSSSDIAAGQNGYGPIVANNPVTSVNWYDVVKWCNARSEKDGLTPVYYTNSSLTSVYRTGDLDLSADAVKWQADGYRLPTEAEWEFAARGGLQTHDYIYSGSDVVDDAAWNYANADNMTHPVGGKIANEQGLYDMSGNAWEWCWDLYGSYSSTSPTDPKGTGVGGSRILRGGAFDYVSNYCRVAYRYNSTPALHYYTFGFRCVQK